MPGGPSHYNRNCGCKSENVSLSINTEDLSRGMGYKSNFHRTVSVAVSKFLGMLLMKYLEKG